jgi:Protein of unknown function (DUF3237)
LATSLSDPPRLTLATDLDVAVAGAVEIGDVGAGERRMIPITGGSARGPLLDGRILPGGADIQIIRGDGVTDLIARYVIEADDGALIYVENRGLRHGPPELLARLREGEPVDPAQIYFRTSPRFETQSGRHQVLTRSLFLGVGIRHPDRVAIRFWKVD